MSFPGALVVKNPSANAGDMGLVPGSGGSLEEEMATHSSLLAWETSWTEEGGGLQRMGLQRIGHDRATEHAHVTEEQYKISLNMRCWVYSTSSKRNS